MSKHTFPFTAIFLLGSVLFSVSCTTVETASDVIDSISDMASATPAPTATPGPIEQAVSEMANTTGINRFSLFHLTGEDWINLFISLLLVFLVYVVARVVIRLGLHLLTRRLDDEPKKAFVTTIEPPLSWLLVVFTLQFATVRLVFINPRAQSLLSNLYFFLDVLIISYFLWRLTDFAEYWYRKKLVEADGRDSLDPVIVGARRVMLIFIVMNGFSLVLSRLGLNTNALLLTLGIMGAAISFAGKDTLSDTISGFLILVDQPFRVGDAIEVETIDDWGVVKEIGLRTTRILTSDNRVVIVPNSIIGKNLVVNYTYPDPNYRVEIRVQVPFGTDMKTVRYVITEAVRRVEGVLPDESVEVLCHEMGESAMVLRVWWWIDNYDHTAFVRDRVIESVHDALTQRGLTLAYPVRDINLRITPERAAERVSQAIRKAEEQDERKELDA